jgi:hypothetical protein
MSLKFSIGAALITVGLVTTPVCYAAEYDGFLAVADPGEASYLAVRVELGANEGIAALRWINNDEVAQPEVYVVAEGPDGLPSLPESTQEIADVSWASLDWVAGSLSQTVGTSSGAAYVVFRYPPFSSLNAEGYAGGCGVGYQLRDRQECALISQDGLAWVEIHPTIDPLLEVTTIEGPETTLVVTGKHSSAPDAEESRHQPTSQVSLHGIAPNPFNPSTTISFDLSNEMTIELSVFNVRGERVRQLRSGFYPAGTYRVMWTGTNDAGQRLANGVYFVRFETGGYVNVSRVALVK